MSDSAPLLAPGAAGLSNAPELSVSELANRLKRTIEDAYGYVRVRGELGRVIVAKSGHMYFDLKDDKAVLSAVMWKGVAAQLRFRPDEGLEVVAHGRLSTFAMKSGYQLICERMEPAGVGALLAQLEKLKAQLASEGLFAAERKKPLPFLPEVIGVVTSPTGAVIRDILHRLADRFPRRVLLWPVLVQGEQAAAQIARAIRGFNALPTNGTLGRPDVLIVARGGGSIEDLWAFNEEAVVRAAAESAIPLISAVGHETDTTLIDHASDLRAPTPSAAAEKAVPVRSELIARLETLGARRITGLQRLVERRRTELKAAGAALPKPQDMLAAATQRLDRAADRLDSALRNTTQTQRISFERLSPRLSPEALVRDITRRGERLAQFTTRLSGARARAAAREQERVERGRDDVVKLGARAQAALVRGHEKALTRLAAAAKLLDSLSHARVLERGFALVIAADGSLTSRSAQLHPGDAVMLQFHDGARAARIDSAEPATPASRQAASQTAAQTARKSAPRGAPAAAPTREGGQGSLF
jgi:exodeoxyribonuclease VII large subunit